MIVLQSNDRKELKRDIAIMLKEYPGAMASSIIKIPGGWFQATILKP
jgi:hypothetical protein